MVNRFCLIQSNISIKKIIYIVDFSLNGQSRRPLNMKLYKAVAYLMDGLSHKVNKSPSLSNEVLLEPY